MTEDSFEQLPGIEIEELRGDDAIVEIADFVERMKEKYPNRIYNVSPFYDPSQKTVALTAKVDGEVVGILSGVEQSERLFADLFLIDDAHRGKKVGLQLMEAAKKQFDTIELVATPTELLPFVSEQDAKLALRSLYETKYGFTDKDSQMMAWTKKTTQ